MAVFSDEVDILDDELHGEDVLTSSDRVLGNGVLNNLQDIIYIKRDKFTFKNSRKITPELARINRTLVSEGRPYMLVVYGRLGTTDPWLGIPVNWGQVSGAKVVVEATPENVSVELSQGSHFFHNIISLGVNYFSIPPKGNFYIDWDWLDQQECISETQYLRHVRLSVPLLIRVDGRRGRGVIYKL